jgi:hypothetical protein
VGRISAFRILSVNLLLTVSSLQTFKATQIQRRGHNVNREGLK